MYIESRFRYQFPVLIGVPVAHSAISTPASYRRFAIGLIDNAAPLAFDRRYVPIGNMYQTIAPDSHEYSLSVKLHTGQNVPRSL